MTVPCVTVSRERGEEVRQLLIDTDALAEDYEIEVGEGRIYIPVDPAAVPDELRDALTERELQYRDRQLTPADLLEFEPSIERLGDIVILDEDDRGRAQEIAAAVMESGLPCETVLNRASPIQGELRVREWDVLAGNGTETAHREYGYEYLLDVAEVYFSPRLATDRRLVAEQTEPTDRVFDMFAGVGPFAIPAADRGADVVACDLNEQAISYLEKNARRNGVAEQITTVQGDVQTIADSWTGWADRIIMNLPHSADEFLETAVRLAGDRCVIHYYDIADAEAPFAPGETAITEAATDYTVSVINQRVVRSYAPGQLNIRVDAELSADGT